MQIEDLNVEKDSNLYELAKEVKRIQTIRKPNTKVFKYSDKLSKKVKKVLDSIEKNNNNSWAMFMFERTLSVNAMDKVAILYRGNKITYAEMYAKAFEYAKSLKAMGVKKGDQVPVCISNVPEYLYLLLACSFVGATIHLVGSWFDKDYLKDILNKTDSKIMFLTEDKFEEISDIIEDSKIEKPILLSLGDSLMKDRNGKPFNPYQVLDGKTHVFESRFSEIKEKSSKPVINQNEFLELGKDYKGEVLENVGLDDISTISYTSGTTVKGCPKGVKHSNRVYITVSRFKNPDVSGMPEMKDLITQYEVPVYSHTNLSNVTDTLYCSCTYAAEPFAENDFFLKSLLINKTNYCQSPLGRWMHLGKELCKEENKDVKLTQLIMADVVGESCSPGEEKFLNRVSREHKFGTKKLPFPLSPVTISMGGGTCEGGGIFFTLFHDLQQKRLGLLSKKYSLGLMPVPMVDYEVLNLDGDYCKINEPGILVVNSPANMSGYTNENFNSFAYTYDKYGKQWLTMGTLVYKADPKFGSIKMKGRVNDFVFLKEDHSIFPTYIIEEAISKDTKNVMSCAVVKLKDDNYVCHIEKQPNSTKSMESILKSCAMRLKSSVPSEIYERIYFRIRNYEEGFPLAESGKRDFEELKHEDNIEDMIYVADAEKVMTEHKNNMSLRLKKKSYF